MPSLFISKSGNESVQQLEMPSSMILIMKKRLSFLYGTPNFFIDKKK